MKIFDEKILKPEEVSGGYNPGEPDDDTFLLESQGEYPGIIPDYQPSDDVRMPGDSMSPAQTANVDETIYDVPQEGSVWDIFKDSKTDDFVETVEETEEEEPYSLEPDSEQIDESMFASLANEILEEEPLASAPTDKIENEGYVYANELEPDESSLRETFVPEAKESESLEFDNDFLASLKSDIIKGATKEEAVAEKETIKSDGKPLFESDGATDEIVVDFATITADKPSTYGLASEDKATKEPNKTEKSEVKEEKPLSEKEKKKLEKRLEKEEKNRNKKPFPWLRLSIAASIVLMLSAIGLGGYFAWEKYAVAMFEHKEPTEEATHKTETHDTAHKTEPKESKHTEETHTQEPSKEEHSAEPPHEEPKAEEMPAPKPSAVETKKESHKSEEHTPAVNSETTTAKRERPPVKPKNEVVPKQIEPQKPIAEKKEPAKQVKIEKPKQEKKVTEEPAIVKNETKDTKTTSLTQSTEEIYTVQVYSSPSVEDAEEWVKLLAQKSINGAYISPQKIRDQIWYRVRFGKFSTRDEARSAASKYGFTQSWVDRIK